MVWLIVAALIGFIVWAIWHERRLRSHEVQYVEQKDAVEAQRLQLEGRQLEERQLERSELQADALAQLSSGDWEPACETLEHLLKHSPPPEQWALLAVVSEHLHRRFGGRLHTAPHEPELLRLLQLFSARPEGFRKGDAGRRECLKLRDIAISGLTFEHLNLRGTDLSQCQFSQSRLPELDLFAAVAEDCVFDDAQLNRANLTGVVFKRVSFTGADLSGAELISAELVACDLKQANLSKAAFRGVRLSGCDLRGVNLDGATGLSFAQLAGCRLDAETRLPENLRERQPELIARSPA